MKYPNSIACFNYGSRVYGTNNDSSDYDYIIVTDDPECADFRIGDDDYHFYTENQFISKIANCEISVLECLYLPEEFREGKMYSANINLSTLRHSISKKSSNSWVKAKKKIEVHNEIYLGKKSLWHSLRILMFGIQLAKHNKITDYSEANGLYTEIMENQSKKYSDYKKKYQLVYNHLSTEFRKLASKI